MRKMPVTSVPTINKKKSKMNRDTRNTLRLCEAKVLTLKSNKNY